MRFSVRDLLLVTVIVALAVGWWVDHRRQNLELERTQASLRQLEFKLEMLTKLFEDNDLIVSLPNSSAPATNPPKK